MKSILQINSGLSGGESQSSILSDALADAFNSEHSGVQFVRRDLSVDPLPHLSLETFRAFADPSISPPPAGLTLSDSLITELQDADTLILGVPMYNFHVPSSLKAWIDHVTRAGKTFQYAEQGPVGLLSNKRAIVCIAQGGSFLNTAADTLTPYLKQTLALIGIKDVEFVSAEGLAMGDEIAKAALAAARLRIAEIVHASSSSVAD